MNRARSDATTSRRTRPVGWIAVAAVVLACTLAAPAEAQPIEEPKTYAGDFWSRPRLTGDWGGFRDEMARKGVRLDVDLLLIPQGVASGGRDTGVEFWGNAERPNDKFGVGWARTEFSSHFVPFLRERLDLGLDHEDAIEMYYNAAITPWLNVTADLQ